MPIIERSARACFDAFADHMRKLIAETVTGRHPLATVPHGSRMILSFREEHPVAIPLDTSYGRIFFYLGQSLEAREEGGRYRLTTRQYWYRIQLEPRLRSQAALRWEYDSTTRADHHARHHTQLSASIELQTARLDLDKAHLPTGWVTIEEVIRFLIVDLGMQPPCGDAWPDVIAESERRFYEDFTSKRYRLSES